MQNLPASVAEWVIVGFIGLLAVLVLIRFWSFNFAGLISEAPDPSPAPGNGSAEAAPTGPGPATTGKASLSRFQLLLFTFAIVGLFLALSLESGKFIDIPNQVLGLLGISGGSYVLSKGIQLNNKSS